MSDPTAAERKRRMEARRQADGMEIMRIYCFLSSEDKESLVTHRDRLGGWQELLKEALYLLDQDQQKKD